MSAGPFLPFFVVLLHICGSSEGLEIITEPGKNVNLRCEVSDKDVVVVLEWSTDGLDRKKVFVIRDGRPFLPAQHESFRNRVFLLDPQMKDGDLSVVLKNVTVNDTGIYECKIRKINDSLGSLKLISSIHLQVSPPPPPPPPPGEEGEQGGLKDGEKEDDGTQKTEGLSEGVVPGIIVAVLFASIVIVVLLIYKKRNCSNQSSGGSNNHQNPECVSLNSDPNSERNTEQNGIMSADRSEQSVNHNSCGII